MSPNDAPTRKAPLRPVHPFPARMAAAIPWHELSEAEGKLRVLDPMAGSGTTLAVARALGHKAQGYDTDPLAVLIARAWCEDVDGPRLRTAARRVLRRARNLLTRIRLTGAYPMGADRETRAFVRYWFDRRNRRELAALSRVILRVRDERVRTLLLCGFSRLIIAKQAGASLALDLAHSRPHRVLSKPTVVRPLEAFLDEVQRICLASPFSQRSRRGPRASVSLADARALPVKNGSVDVVITSPPYVNGIDYQRTTKFSLIWMGYSVADLRRVRAENIGTEAAGLMTRLTASQARALRAMGSVSRLPARTVRILAKYVRDMDNALAEVARVLRPDGRALVVIGDSTIRNTFIRNSQALIVLARAHDLKTVGVRRRRLPPNRRYLPPPRANDAGLDGRLRTEALLHLRKSA